MTAFVVQNDDRQKGRRRATTGAIESSFLISSPARLEAGEEAKEVSFFFPKKRRTEPARLEAGEEAKEEACA